MDGEVMVHYGWGGYRDTMDGEVIGTLWMD